MQSIWGEIYCYLVLFVTSCAILVTSCFLITNAYDLYYPPNFDHQILKSKFEKVSKEINFDWQASTNKDLKEYANRHYAVKNSLTKDMIRLVFFVFMSMAHVLILRRFKKTA